MAASAHLWNTTGARSQRWSIICTQSRPPDHAFAMSIRLRAPHRRLEDRQTHRHGRGIDALRINAVAVVNDPSMGPIA